MSLTFAVECLKVLSVEVVVRVWMCVYCAYYEESESALFGVKFSTPTPHLAIARAGCEMRGPSGAEQTYWYFQCTPIARGVSLSCDRGRSDLQCVTLLTKRRSSWVTKFLHRMLAVK